MCADDRTYWNERYRRGSGPRAARADQRLTRFGERVNELAARHQLAGARPAALDVACGAGGTVRWLARRGWSVTGVDISEVALQLAADGLAADGTDHLVDLRLVDLTDWRPAADAFDLVTCFFYWDPALLPALGAAVRPGGLLIYETFNRHRLAERPDSNEDFLLEPGRLRKIVAGWGWEVLASQSAGPDTSRPTDWIAARKPTVKINRLQRKRDCG
jgi:tellurite methyltransferase